MEEVLRPKPHHYSPDWPLIPPGGNEIDPKVASLWLAVDDVGPDNGTKAS